MVAGNVLLYAVAGRKQQAQMTGILQKSESTAVHAHHGNPFSEDEEHNEKPLLIASAGSSYAMDPTHRYAPQLTPQRCNWHNHLESLTATAGPRLFHGAVLLCCVVFSDCESFNGVRFAR